MARSVARQRVWVWLLAVAAATPALALAGEEATVDLRPDFRAGRESRYSLWYEREVNTTAKFGGRSNSLRQTFHYDSEVTWKVEKVGSDGSATCTMVINWLALTSSDSQGGKRVNDTRKASGDVPAVHEMLKAMAAKTLRFQVSADGTIRKVEGVQAVRGAAPKETAEAITDEQFIELAYDLALMPNAPAAAAKGTAWEAKLRTTHELGWLEEQSTFTVKGFDEVAGTPLAIIGVRDKGRFEPRLPDLPANGPKVSLSMRGEQSERQIMWDLIRHEAVGRHITQSRTFQMRLSLGGKTMTRSIEESSQQQVLRIAEN